MIYYLLNYYNDGRVKEFNTSSNKTLKYLLLLDTNLICINYQLKMIINTYVDYYYKKKLEKIMNTNHGSITVYL